MAEARNVSVGHFVMYSVGLFVCRTAKLYFPWPSEFRTHLQTKTHTKNFIFCISIDDLWSQYHRIHVVAMKSSLINAKSTNTTAQSIQKPKYQLIRFSCSPSSEKNMILMIHMKIDGSNEQIRRVIYIAALQNTQFMTAPQINSRPFYLDPGHRTNDKYSKHESATN